MARHKMVRSEIGRCDKLRLRPATCFVDVRTATRKRTAILPSRTPIRLLTRRGGLPALGRVGHGNGGEQCLRIRMLRVGVEGVGVCGFHDAATVHHGDSVAEAFRDGQVVGRLLLANGIQTTVLDHDPGQIETLRKFGFKVFYGDASRLELLHAAGAESADLLVLAIDDREATLDILREVREHFPKLPVLARAVDRVHAYEALRLGADSVHRETFGSAVEMGIVALRKLGFRAHNALRAGRTFHHHDEAAMHELAAMREDFGGYITRRAQMREELERILQKELRETTHETDSAWDGMLIERPD